MLAAYQGSVGCEGSHIVRPTIHGKSFALAGGASIAMVSSLLIAAPAAATTQEAGIAADDGSGQEIIVTAQRRPERLEDVPISITSISAQHLEEAGVKGLFDLSTVTPGVRVDHYGAYAQPTIRGIGTQDVLGPGANANVAIYVDGFYMPSQTGNIFDFANVQRVDVLKGPQGTLFGQNATGGAILVTTLEPSHATTFTVNAGYGSFDEIRADFYGSTGITENLAADLSVYYPTATITSTMSPARSRPRPSTALTSDPNGSSTWAKNRPSR